MTQKIIKSEIKYDYAWLIYFLLTIIFIGGLSFFIISLFLLDYRNINTYLYIIYTIIFTSIIFSGPFILLFLKYIYIFKIYTIADGYLKMSKSFIGDNDKNIDIKKIVSIKKINNKLINNNNIKIILILNNNEEIKIIIPKEILNELLSINKNIIII